ncbi:unnamed protein product [Diamesa hyperborea]
MPGIQLNLSTLVDVALGKSQFSECEQFNMLHTFLQILLKKLNMADSQVELCDELAERACEIMKDLPEEPSISFKEYTIKDGEKKKRRNIAKKEICLKKSLTLVTSNWKCVPSAKISSTTTTINYDCNSDTVTPVDSEMCGSNQNEVVCKLTNKIENMFDCLAQRMRQMETQMCNLNCQFDCQSSQNRSAMDEFIKLKNNFERLSADVDRMKNTEMSSEDLQFIQKATDAATCEVKVNFTKKSMDSSENNSECEESADENHNENSSLTTLNNEIKNMHEQIYDLSQNLDMHSLCLKKMKCEDMLKMKQSTSEMCKYLQNTKSQIQKNEEIINAIRCDDIEGLRVEVDRLKSQTCCMLHQLKQFESKIECDKNEQCQKMCHMQQCLEDKIKCISERSSSAEGANSSWTSSCSSPSTVCTSTEYLRSEPLQVLESGHENVYRTDSCCTNSNCRSGSRNSNCNDHSQTNSQCQCTCIICKLQKQVSSHSFCLQQLIRDIKNKLDRCEFEMSRKELSETIDVVMAIREKQERALYVANAAGGVVPLMKNLNCISCNTTTNMTLTTAPVPKLPQLNFARIRSEYQSHIPRVLNQRISQQNWNCYNETPANLERRTGGCHTKINKADQFTKMRFKRLKTPCLKRVTSMLMYRNRFRRSSLQTRNCHNKN